MIHYHGTPIGGKKEEAARFLVGRHALVSFAHPDDLDVVADVCKSFVLDNGAFSVWKKGGTLDFDGYGEWVWAMAYHPGFTWCLIPDVIEGTAKENDDMLDKWRDVAGSIPSVPVWHLHESLSRLKLLAKEWHTVALGSSGVWKTPGTRGWWSRMDEALATICLDDGRPSCRLHGLRMLNPELFTRLPLASADSCNAAINSGSLSRFGQYCPPTSSQRATVIADRIESHNAPATWQGSGQQDLFALISEESD